MKLEQVTVQNYKSIGNDVTLKLDPKSTVLVGKSNVGKSNILEAIHFAFNDNPIPDADCCSWCFLENDQNCIELIFGLEPKDKEILIKEDADLESKTKVEVEKKRNGIRKYHFIPKSESKTVFIPPKFLSHFLARLRSRTRKVIRKFNALTLSIDSSDNLKMSFIALSRWMESDKKLFPLDEQQEQVHILNDYLSKLQEIRTLLKKFPYNDKKFRGVKQSISMITTDIKETLPDIKYVEKKVDSKNERLIEKLMPDMVYLKSNDKLEINDKILINDIKNTDDVNFMRQLLFLSGINAAIFTNGDRRKIRSEIEKANISINQRLSKYWNQEQFRIELNYDTELVKEGIEEFIELDFIGEEGHRGSIFDQSPGVRWFLSFVVNNLIHLNDENRNTLLLLDEPGVALHAAAQFDLLDRFEKTDSSIQILYTTHSPFLINKNYPLRISSVNKEDEKSSKRGTTINQKPYHSQKGMAWEPIRSAIGLPAGASLFVAGNNLIVEGIADQILIAGVIQAMAKGNEKLEYDMNKVCICFAGTPANIIALSLFCHQETKKAKVLLDSDTGNTYKTKLIKSNFPKERIFLLSDIQRNKTFFDIEDLLDAEFYHTCFVQSYSELPVIIEDDKFPKTWDIIKNEFKDDDTKSWGHSKFYSEYFKRYEDNLGGYNKVIVAQKVVMNMIDMDKKELNRKTKNFKKILDKIWSADPIWL